MSIEDRLKRLETRQEALIAAVHGLTNVTETNQEMLSELMKWLQEPPSSELPDLLRELTATVKEQGERITTMHGLLVKLPAQIARSVQTGEVV